jgi:tRNA (guanine26-N2/guanine27-N2)-dimethyltransferase
MPEVTEGGVTVEVDEVRDGASAGAGEGVFYNPTQEFNRDLTVAVLRAYRDREPRVRTYLDAMTASGVRAVRAAKAGYDVTAVDVDADAAALARRNLARNDLDGAVLERDVNALLHERDRDRAADDGAAVFDVVDLDPFGSPIPFADAALANARNLVAVTATDTAPLCGAHFESGVRRYTTVPRNTEYHPEMGLRVLVSALVRTAARYDVAATPILSHVTRHYARTYLELDRGARAADEAVDQLGYVHHCEDCLHRTADRDLLSHPPERCPACEGPRVLTAGPIHLGPVRDRTFVDRVREAVTEEMGSADDVRDTLATVRDELDTPTHYDQHRLCKLWGRSAPKMDAFIEAVRAAGFDASRAHYAGTAFKSTADAAAIREATAHLPE